MGHMSKSNLNMTKTDQIEEQAVTWMARNLSGNISPEEKHRFSEWMKIPEHAAAYEAITHVAASVDELSEDLLAEHFEAELNELEAASRPRRSFVPAFAAMAASLVAAAGIWSFFLDQPEYLESHYATLVGEREAVPLVDGSTITLNTSTTIDVSYDDRERRVAMAQGEAYFSVASEPDREFSVLTDHGRITVTGTSFNVRTSNGETTVSVVSGAVDVLPAGGDHVTLLAGEAVSFGPERQGAIKTHYDATRVLSWRSGRAIFEETPLVEVTDELNRYFPVPLVLAPGVMMDAPVTGEFDLSDPTTAIRGLSVAMSLDVTQDDSRIVLAPAEDEE